MPVVRPIVETSPEARKGITLTTSSDDLRRLAASEAGYPSGEEKAA